MTGDLQSGTIHRLVAEFLEVLPEAARRVVYLSAIPTAINPGLLQKITGDPQMNVDFLENLQEVYLLNKGEGDWYYFTPEVRDVLRAFWHQPGQQQVYQQTTRTVIAYFDQLARQTGPPGNSIYESEALYHRLLEDERAGLDHMAGLFEDAFDRREIGAAQKFLASLMQALPELSPLAAQHTAYYKMRIDFMLFRQTDLVQGLGSLIGETTDPLLKARAGMLLGQVLLSRYEWKRSREVLKASLVELKRLKSWRFAARGMLALGDVYVDLVENSGGVQIGGSTDRGKVSQFLTRLLFLPFLLLGWLSRKIWFLPGWFYFGANYQDWILNYLLEMAGSWYRRARRMARKAGDSLTLENALLGDANVAVQQGRAAKARRKYFRLAALPGIRSSTYRMAQIHYGQGLVALLNHWPIDAHLELQMALDICESFADEASLGKVAFALGRTYLQLGDQEAAAWAFLLSFRTFAGTKDALSQTQASWELELLVEKKQVGPETERQIREALPLLEEKQFVARFPTDLLRRFRNLAFLVALPISYLLGLLIALLTTIALITIEQSVQVLSKTGSLTQTDLFFLMVGLLPIVMNFWIVQLVYAAIGQAWVVLVGHLSLNSLGEQPDRIFLGPEAVAVDSPGLREPIRIRWDEIREIVSADYRLYQRTIYLFSRLGIVGSGKSIIIDGITSGYSQIRREIIKRKGDLFLKPGADTVLLTHPTTYLTLLIALWYAVTLVQAGQIDITVENLDTHQTTILSVPQFMAAFGFNLLLFFPPLLLWRINLNRRLFSQHLGKRPRRLLNFISFGFTLLLTALAVLWLFYGSVMKID